MWDGRNNSGEEVNSGVYLGILKCGGFQKTIKLTLLH